MIGHVFAPAGQNVVMIRITSYRSKRPRGVLTGPDFKKNVPFASLIQLLLMMDASMDAEDFPQRGEERRAFGSVRPGPAEESDGLSDTLATFQVRVLFRQNASWQGTLLWVERRLEAQFRSALELIRLIDSALSVQKGE